MLLLARLLFYPDLSCCSGSGLRNAFFLDEYRTCLKVGAVDGESFQACIWFEVIAMEGPRFALPLAHTAQGNEEIFLNTVVALSKKHRCESSGSLIMRKVSTNKRLFRTMIPV